MASGVLNFDVGNKITGVNVIDGHLLFTDNRNEPRKVNIARFRDEGNHTSGTTEIYGREFKDKDISVIKKHPEKAPTIQNIVTDTDSAKFEDVFPRISYRWHFKDNEHSPFAPFTEAVYQGGTELDFKDMFETGDFTYTRNIINSFDVVVPITEADIIQCDLLYTESISSTVYIVESKDVLAADITAGTITFTVNSRNHFKALPPSQLTRIFDEVPRRAKAQDIVANRVIYGNYLDGYNNTNVGSTLSTQNLALSAAALSVRNDTTYNVGIAFIDEKGRQGGLMDLGSISTPFHSSQPIKLTAQLSGNSPTWASKYRYYVKDTSGTSYNIKSFAAFDNEDTSTSGSSEIWLAVTSDDINKVQEGDYILRKAHQRIDTFPGYESQPNLGYGGANPIFTPITAYNKRKVLEIKNEAPESVKYGLIDKRLVSSIDSEPSRITYKFAANNDNYATAATLAEGETIIAVQGTSLLTTIGDELGESKIVYVAIDNNTSHKIRVTGVEAGKVNDPAQDGTVIKLATPLTSGSVSGISGTVTIRVYSTQFKDDALRVLDGKFFIKTTKDALSGTDILSTSFDESITYPHLLDHASMTNNGVACDMFTVEPADESNLELYWEASTSFDVGDDFGTLNVIDWTNSIAIAKNATSPPFLNIDKYLDRYNSVSLGKGVRVNTPLDDASAQRNKHKLIFSGIINPNTRTNRLNEFITADGITKDINPKYGDIQKLYAQDNLMVFCHDKVVKVLANKDALYNADENVNLISTNNVLGQAIGLNGEYGISDNPESFATFGFNIFFTDRQRGKILKLTPINGQINDISKLGMRDFIRDRIIGANSIVGSFDEYSNKYIVCIKGYDASLGLIDQYNMLDGEEGSINTNITLGFHDNGQQSAWTSRYSFIPEAGISSLGKYYTFKEGKCWAHHDGIVAHNNFYGTQYHSEVQFIFNDNPTSSNEWVSLNYEGTPDWDVIKIQADQEEGIMEHVDILDGLWFKKEGKYFGAIVGEEPVYSLVPGGLLDSDGHYRLQDTGESQIKAGVKGFYNKVTLRNNETTKQELFAVSAESYQSAI